MSSFDFLDGGWLDEPRLVVCLFRSMFRGRSALRLSKLLWRMGMQSMR
jgi:hypothetical protein